MKDIDALLKSVKRIHFIGIGGSGMCPIAEILHKEGYLLSGSDNNETDTLARIRSLGIPVVLGQKAENIEGAQMIVYTAAILPDNPELVAAKASGIPTFERSVVLGAITRLYPDCICISGTHGKTTSSSMLTQILIEAGFDPSAVIGGKLPLTGTNGIVGHSEHMVCEACEFCDHFLQLSPDIAVILNVDEDHLEYFKNLDNIKRSFAKFASMATKAVIYNGDDENTCSAVAAAETDGKQLITFGLGEKTTSAPSISRAAENMIHMISSRTEKSSAKSRSQFPVSTTYIILSPLSLRQCSRAPTLSNALRESRISTAQAGDLRSSRR